MAEQIREILCIYNKDHPIPATTNGTYFSRSYSTALAIVNLLYTNIYL